MNIIMRNTINAVSAVSIICVLGCGLFGGGKVGNEVINADLAKQELLITEGTSKTWYFPGDEGRCFDDTDSKYSGDTAELTVTVASFHEANGLPDTIFTVFGQVIMTYKRDGKTWTLEKAESKELIQQALSMDKFEKFLEISAPLCRNYRAPPS